jgi:hypothetical protein
VFYYVHLLHFLYVFSFGLSQDAVPTSLYFMLQDTILDTGRVSQDAVPTSLYFMLQDTILDTGLVSQDAVPTSLYVQSLS